MHELLRSSHLAKLSMHRVADALEDFDMDTDAIKLDQANNIAKLEAMMARERVRPSILQGPAPAALGALSVGCRLLLGAGPTNSLLWSLEKGMQDEHDEQLRILNEQGLQEPELRKVTIEMRDKGFDSVKDRPKSDSPQALAWTSFVAMRVARQV